MTHQELQALALSIAMLAAALAVIMIPMWML
jgi:hypothetical protein